MCCNETAGDEQPPVWSDQERNPAAHRETDDERAAASARRRFLSWSTGVIASLVAAALGVPILGYAIAPALRRENRPWADAGSLAALTMGQPTKVEYFIERRDGWIETTNLRSAWVIRQTDDSLVVYDPRCTHLGCPITWDVQTQRFYSPCHNGVFAIDGAVISGPPPRPLDRYSGRLQNSRVLIREEAPPVPG